MELIATLKLEVNLGHYVTYYMSFQVQVSSSGVGEAAGNVVAAAATTVAAANRFRGRDFSNLNPFATNDSTNPFDED